VVDRLVKDILAYAQSHHLRGDTALITDESLAKLREIVPLARDWERLKCIERAARDLVFDETFGATQKMKLASLRAVLDLKETPE
jgi:hypothetical protein